MAFQPLKAFKSDLHIHTCLSPCGDWSMSPGNIIQESVKKKINIIAVCDHNSAQNAHALMKLGAEKNICVLPGMEICSKEEVHILGIFGQLDHALAMQKYIYKNLPGKNSPGIFGYQIEANENDEVEGECERFLLGATTLSISTIVNKIHELCGLAIASHIDRPAFGIISQLGFIPLDLDLDAVEISPRITTAHARKTLLDNRPIPCVTFSDAHYKKDVGTRYTTFLMAEPTVQEILKALASEDGRKMETI